MERIRIEINGRIDKDRAEWFEGMEITYHDDSTIMTGELPDHSALHGILNKIRDLNLKLISVKLQKKNK